MSLDEAENVQLAVKRGRYDKGDVDAYVASLIESYRGVTLERNELRERVASLEGELAGISDLERELRDCLIAAQRVAKDLRDTARKERDEIVEAARIQATNVRDEMTAERDQLQADINRLRNLDAQMKTGYKQFLAAALELLNEATGRAAPEMPQDERDLAEIGGATRPSALRSRTARR